MSKELKGYTNRLQANIDGSITKFFSDDGVTSRLAVVRLQTEKKALGSIPITPYLIDETPNSLTMSTVDGERNLDNLVDQMHESLQLSVFESVGMTLGYLHSNYRRCAPNSYLINIICDSTARVALVADTLKKLGIDKEHLTRYFRNSINIDEIRKHGITITHGDYWLNNIIGQVRNNIFDVAGVIDWEMGAIASPYYDFANVKLSIFNYHPLAIETFWRGYGSRPNPQILDYFCARQIITWISEDGSPNFDSDFYANKIKFLRSIG